MLKKNMGPMGPRDLGPWALWAPGALGPTPFRQHVPKCLQMRHGFDNMFQNALKCDMVSTTFSKMLSNVTWFRQHVPKCSRMRHGFDNMFQNALKCDVVSKYKYQVQVPTSTKYKYQVQVQVQVWLVDCFIDSLFVWLIDCVDILGPGPLGAPGPRCRIRVVHVTTYCQASYLLSGKLPTVRHAPKRSRRLCTQQPHTCTQQPHTCTQQPHTCTQPIHRHAPKRHRHAPKRLHILCTQQPYTFSSSNF